MDGGLKKEIQDIMDRFDEALEADRDNREDALDDLQFIAGEQWPAEIKADREANGRPMLTINQMPQFVRQVTGDIRQANPAIDVIPGDGDASDDMADMLSGLIRGVEYQCDASSIYERAAESAASCGMGAFRTYYKQTNRGNEIVIEGISNPFAVYWDPLAKDPTRKDARFCFVTDKMGLEEFKEVYPKADVSPFESGDVTRQYDSWFSDENVTVAEYWEKKGGRVFWSKVSGVEVLEGPIEFPGDYIPIVAVVGEEMHLGDRVIRTSVIRHAKDSQRLYNYSRTAQAEVIALQPKMPYLVTARQIEGYEAWWNTANTANRPYLPYQPDQLAPPPKREQPPVASSGLMQEIMIAADEMKSTTGIYKAALGESSGEKSGIAIQQRQRESDISTSIYVDNLSKSIAQCGRVVVGLIPFVYDTTRLVRTMQPDGSARMVEFNTPIQTPVGPMYANDPSFGSFDVRIKTGPSYSTQKQESVEHMLEFVRAFPAAGEIAGDLVARNMDWPGADELAERLAKMLPPGVAASKEDIPPEQAAQEQQQQQQMMQMQQMMEQLSMAKAQAEADEAQADAAEAQADAQKAGLEVKEKEFELALRDGRMNEAIQRVVNDAVARALQARMGFQPRF